MRAALKRSPSVEAGRRLKRLLAALPALYSDITDTLAYKLDAMRCYASELRDFPHPRSLKAIGMQAELFGAHANTAAAEAFSVLRGTWDTHISQSKEV